MIDIGLASGFQKLYENDEFLDYTIEVEEQKFKVHKAVLIAISDYFQIMFSGSLIESKTDRVVLKGLTAESVSKLIEFIYTGKEQILTNHLDSLLSCAVYFQMGTIIDVCVQRMMITLNVRNCLDILSELSLYSLHDKADKVNDFIKSNWHDVIKYPENHKGMPEDLMRLIIDRWHSSDWALFIFIKDWYEADTKNHNANNLMSKVAFSVMGPGELSSIKDMGIYTECEGAWRDLVNAALKYHEQPINLQILDTSVKIKPGSNARPVFFTTGNSIPSTTLYVGEHGWKKYTTQNAPFRDVVNAIEVNNFLIVCCEGESKVRPQKWYIFNPHTLTWSAMDCEALYSPRTGFALIYYGNCLYTLGGEYNTSGALSDKAERYSLETKKWESVINMSEPVTNHSACVLGDLIYVCGGWRQKRGGHFSGSGKLECCVMQTGEWLRKAPLPRAKENHQMSVMTLRNEEAIVVIDQDFQIDYYSPESNQWTTYDLFFNDDSYVLEWGPASTMMCRGNCVYFLNVSRFLDESSDEEEDIPRYSYACQAYCHYPCCGHHSCHDEEYREEGICWKWTFPENSGFVSEMKLSDFPSHVQNQRVVKPFGAVLYTCD